VSRKNEVVRFVVPPGTTANRFSSSLQLPTSGVARIAPEFVNIRHRVVQAGTGADVRRRRTRVATKFDCEISDTMLFWREDQGAWRRA
jgi:hypothetical protein